MFWLSCDQRSEESITIAASANLQYALEDLIDDFEEQTQIGCNLVVSSSGILTAQIQEGAPYDIFLSADMKYPAQLFEAGLALEEPMVYAYGRLVLWTLKDEINLTLEALSSEEVDYIAMANPKTAPYGLAAEEVLQFLKLKTTVEEKLVYGESISQTNQFITSQSADLGFTAKSVVMAPNLVDKGYWLDLDTSWYNPIAQGVIVIDSGSSRDEQALKFKDFLLSDRGKKILNNFGYSSVNK